MAGQSVRSGCFRRRIRVDPQPDSVLAPDGRGASDADDHHEKIEVMAMFARHRPSLVGRPSGTRPFEVTVVRSAGCHLCDDALAALEEISAQFPLSVRVVDFDSPEGRELRRQHRPPMPPLVLVDGQLFGWGRLSRGKFRRLLEAAV